MDDMTANPGRANLDEQEPKTLDELFAPEALADDLFKFRNVSSGWPRLFGGQVIGQALAAASATVGDDRLVNSLHAYFLRAGVQKTPIECRVERERDGSNFSNRRVLASQGGKSMLSLLVSFHTGEKGPSRDDLQMPDMGNPEDHRSYQEIPVEAAALSSGMTPTELMEVRPAVGGRMAVEDRSNGDAHSVMWMRFRDRQAVEPNMARLMMAYASDFMMIGTALTAHCERVGPGAVIASVDHAVRFHATPDVSDWFLVLQTSDWAGEGRTYIHATIYGRDGTRIASVTQEGLLRMP